MRPRDLSWMLGTVLLSMAAVPLQAGLIVSQWALGSQVNSVIPSGVGVTYFTVVEHPFQDSQTATLGNSFVTTSYDFSWANDSGSFNTISHQQAAQLYGHVVTSDTVHFTPSIDSTFSFSSSFSYNWPSSVIGLAAINIGVSDITDPSNPTGLFGGGRQGGNYGLDPPFGTLQLSHSIPLQAGHDYEFIYETQMQQDNPSAPGTYGTADADIDFTITPLPEPATVALLLPIILLGRLEMRGRYVYAAMRRKND